MAAEKIIVELQVVDGQAVAAWKNQDGLEQKQILNAGIIKEEFSTAYQKISTELTKYTTANEQSAAELSKFILAEGMTGKEVEGVTRFISQQNQTVALNSQAYKDNIVAIQNLQNGYMKAMQSGEQMAGVTRTVTGGSNMMNMAVFEFGNVLQDSGMMLTNFRMGLMGVSARLPNMLYMLQQAKSYAGEGATMFQLLSKSMMGAGGMIFAINAVMLILNVFLPMLVKTTDTVKDQKAEVDKLNESYKKLIENIDKITDRDEVVAKKLVSDVQLKSMKDQIDNLNFLKSSMVQGGQLNVDESTNLKFGSTLLQSGLVNQNVSPDKALTQFAGDKKSLELLNQKIESMNTQVQKEKEYNDALANNINLTTVFANKKKETSASQDKQAIKTDEEIKKEIANYEAKLKTNLSLNERYEIINKIYNLTKLLSKSEDDIEASIKKTTKSLGVPEQDAPGIDKSKFTMTKVADQEAPKPDLTASILSAGELTKAYDEAGKAAMSAGMAQVKMFKDSNNIAMVFLSTLAKVLLETLAIKAASAIFNIFTGGTAGILGLADGAIVTKPTLAMIGEGKEPEGVFPLSKLSGIMNAGTMMQITSNMQTGGIEKLLENHLNAVNNWQKELSFKMDLFDMRAGNNRANDVYNKYVVK